MSGQYNILVNYLERDRVRGLTGATMFIRLGQHDCID